MSRAEQMATRLERVFTIIENGQMAGIPVLNLNLEVEAVGFRDFNGRCLGVIITPWLMNLMLFAAVDEDWSGLAIGRKCSHDFPAGRRDFLVNHFDEIGICQTLALYSPMSGFAGQEQARAAARRSLAELMNPGEGENKGARPAVRQPAAPRIDRGDFIRGRFSGKNRP